MANGAVRSVRVDMGEPVTASGRIPARTGLPEFIDQPVAAGGNTYRMTCVNMGNPHAVTFVGDVGALDLSDVGPPLENHPLFPERANIEFVEVIDGQALKMRVWERGSGETLACGTGACASLVARRFKRQKRQAREAGPAGRRARHRVARSRQPCVYDGSRGIRLRRRDLIYPTPPAQIRL